MFFFFNCSSTTEIYTLSLHDALPISKAGKSGTNLSLVAGGIISRLSPHSRSTDPGTGFDCLTHAEIIDRKSTRLNSSHVKISYAVFCLKKKTIVNVNPVA